MTSASMIMYLPTTLRGIDRHLEHGSVRA